MNANILLSAVVAAALTAPSARAAAADAVSKSTRTPEFSAAIPEDWSPRQEPGALLLLGPSDENRLRSLIVVRYYPPGDKTFSGSDAYVKRQSTATMFDLPGDKPAVVTSTEAAGRKARRIFKEKTETANPGKMNSRGIPSKEELVVVDGKRGFYVLSYSAPTALFDRNRPAYVEVLKAFKPLK